MWLNGRWLNWIVYCTQQQYTKRFWVQFKIQGALICLFWHCSNVPDEGRMESLWCSWQLSQAGTSHSDQNHVCSFHSWQRNWSGYCFYALAYFHRNPVSVVSSLLCKNGVCLSWVHIPAHWRWLKAVVARYTHMGFPGCVCSTDCIHFYWGQCVHNSRHLYLGKEGKPTVAYSMIVNHNQHIRLLTIENPGGRNDKSISQYDKSIQDVR